MVFERLSSSLLPVALEMLLQRYKRRGEDCYRCNWTEDAGKGEGQRDEGVIAGACQSQSTAHMLGRRPLCILTGCLKWLPLWCLLGCKGPVLPLLVFLHCFSPSFTPTTLRRLLPPPSCTHPSAHSQVHQNTSRSPW